MIIKESHVNDLDLQVSPDLTFDDIKARREQNEGQRIERVKAVEIGKIIFQDEMFGKFSSLYEGVRLDDPYLAKDLKEFWVFWLNKEYKNEDDLHKRSVDEEFKRFEADAATIIGSADSIGQIHMPQVVAHNPFYLITKADHALGSVTSKKPEKR